MKLIIDNIGSITSASIELGHLTVIAGENDVGKSTVGRVFFALVQAFSNHPLELRAMQIRKIRHAFDEIQLDLRRAVDLADHPELNTIFKVQRLRGLMGAVANLDQIGELRLALEKLATANSVPIIVIQRSQKLLTALTDEVRNLTSGDDAISGSVFRALQSEFSEEIVNKSQTSDARISLVDGETTILKITFNDAGITTFWKDGPLGFDDATLVEGPAILQYRNALRGFDALGALKFLHGSIPFHSIDLIRKLESTRSAIPDIQSTFPTVFDDLYAGKMFYDPEKRDFLLDQGSYKIASNNAATGIKAIAILEMLIKGGFVTNSTLLILDEPETNLHPKWQIAYARLLCDLAEKGANILVTTHSPYMLEALKGYSSKIDDAKFYLAQKDANRLVSYTDTMGDITPIIRALSQPLADLIDEISNDF
jgi:ABC-type transport system involved in cytochrome c biogenesis ATPase subunit